MIGLEKEYFVVNINDAEQKLVLVPPGLAHDDCGWLAEARGEPRKDLTEAVYSLMADEFRLTRDYAAQGLKLITEPFRKVDRDLRLAARRIYNKGVFSYQNIHGFKDYRIKYPMAPAGIHVSFTNPCGLHDKEGNLHEVNKMFDYCRLFRAIDTEFQNEIDSAKRRGGFYELKVGGRIEYRSLPNNITAERLIEGLSKAMKEANW